MASDANSTRRMAVIAAGIAGLAVLLAGWLIWRTRSPQIGTDQEVFAAVDALFTAVTARDEKLLGQCEGRLHALKDAGKLPADASDCLDGIVRNARTGGWQSAAKRLYGFMTAQRRDGAGEPSHKKHMSRGAPKSRGEEPKIGFGK